MTIQETGKQILTNNPGSFYIFCGEEYGIKYKYIELIKSHYGKCVESNSVNDVLSFMRRKHLLPIQPTLYIVRYDESFLSSLTDKTAEEIENTKIIGTVVCIYELEKHQKKCSKYLDMYTVAINKVNPEFIKQYLVSDYPDLPTECIDIAIKLRDDYMGARNICESMKYSGDYINDTKSMILAFGSINDNDSALFRTYFAAKNFSGCLYVIDNFNGDLNSLFYVMLNALVEIERLLGNPKAKSDLGRYQRSWNINNVYHAFTHIYDELKKSRNCLSYDIYDRLIYLLSVCFCNDVPLLGVI